MTPEWNHPAIELFDQIAAALKGGTDPSKLEDQLAELRVWIVQLAALDPRD